MENRSSHFLGIHKSIHISGCKFFIYFAQKTYFFYFTHPILQNTHISLSILHIYSIKYSFFYHFLLFSSLPLSPSQSQPPSSSLPRLANHLRSNQLKIKKPFKIKPTQDQKPIQAETHSIQKPNHHPPNPKPTDQTTRNQ